jgi:hypothetical protein
VCHKKVLDHQLHICLMGLTATMVDLDWLKFGWVASQVAVELSNTICNTILCAHFNGLVCDWSM